MLKKFCLEILPENAVINLTVRVVCVHILVRVVVLVLDRGLRITVINKTCA